MNSGKTFYTERGIGAVALAFILPIFLVLAIGSLELFLYFRAVSVVHRAAAEAAQAVSAAAPGGTAYTSNSLPLSTATSDLTTSSGGVSDVKQEDLTIYGPAIAGLVTNRIPFALSDTVLPNAKTDTFSSWTSGVMYLPFVSVPTCLEPVNATSHASDSCGDDTALPADDNPYLQFLTYQLPTKMDFDGDSLEDLAFFYNNAGDNDWWIIPSSSGGNFRNALSMKMNEETISSTLNWLPCPADYDGDGMTDLCTTALIQGAYNKIYLNISFSAQYFHVTHNFSLVAEAAEVILPMAGRWDKSASQDQFAVVYTTSSDPSTNLATYVWPTFVDSGTTQPSAGRFSLTDSPTKYADYKYRPEPGRMWRPAFGNYDGVNAIEIGWVTWQGGYKTGLIAGTGTIGETTATTPAKSAQIAPWGLEWGDGGLYVVEQQNHVISLIKPGADGILDGTGADENYIIVAGEPNGSDYTFSEPDPLGKGLFSAGSIPTAEGDVGCDSCYPGGGFTSDEGIATEELLNHPRDISVATAALYIADYGNWRVRVVKPSGYAADTIIEGSSDEMMYTEVGGITTQDCLGLYGTGAAAGEAAWTYEQWVATALGTTTILSTGVHPRCLAIRPTAVYYDRTNKLLYVGDENARVFVVSGGANGILDAWDDKNDVIKLVSGAKTAAIWNANMPAAGSAARGQGYGIPTAISLYSGELAVLFRSASIPAASAVSTGPAPIGGVVVFDTGADLLYGTSDDIVSANSPIVGTWDAAGSGPSAWGTPTTSPAGDLRNPTDFVTYQYTSTIKHLGVYLTDWWIDSGNSTYENALLHVHNSGVMATPLVRWLNRVHSNSWGKRPPTTPNGQWTYAQLTNNDRVPLASLPAIPSGGVALSSNGRMLYFSQTTQGNIMGVYLDADSDGKIDLATSTDVALIDNDSDGDGVRNFEDKFPFLFQTSDGTTENVRNFDTYQDPMLWATGLTSTSVYTGGADVDRLEWWLDRVTEVSAVPLATPEQVPAEEEPIFRTFGNNTVAVANGRGTLHHTPVWDGGPDRSTEGAKLAPIVIADTHPNGYEVKDISGYDQCPDFAADETSSSTTLLSTGEPQTSCTRDLAQAQYADGRTVGTRRAHLAHWTGNWHSVADEDASAEYLYFVDWDGDGVRNPAVVNSSSATGEFDPVEVYIGNLNPETGNDPVDDCPNAFAMADLQKLGPELAALAADQGIIFPYASAAEPLQMSCDEALFFSWDPVPYVRVLANYRAEWKVSSSGTTTTSPATESVRLSNDFDSNGTSALSPVAETAYRVLERTLTVSKRGVATEAHNALVNIEQSVDGRDATITVSYVIPVLKILKPIIGSTTMTVKSSVKQRIYDSGKNE